MFNGLNGLKNLGIIVAIIVSLGGVIVGAETRYGKAVDVKQNSQGIQAIRLERQLEMIQRRIYWIEEQFGFDESRYPPKYRQEYRQLQIELENIKRQLDNL